MRRFLAVWRGWGETVLMESAARDYEAALGLLRERVRLLEGERDCLKRQLAGAMSLMGELVEEHGRSG